MWELLVKGGVVMVPIGICSVLALAIILERLWSLRTSQILPRDIVDRVEAMVRKGDLERAVALCEISNTSYARIVQVGLKNAGLRRAVIKEFVEEAGRQEVVHLERYLGTLGTIAAVSPLLGLLGTVFGMIDIFSVITSGSIGNPTLLAGGISEALITTAAGLVVAIPTLAFHRYFEGLIDHYVVGLERFALAVVEQIKSGH